MQNNKNSEREKNGTIFCGNAATAAFNDLSMKMYTFSAVNTIILKC